MTPLATAHLLETPSVAPVPQAVTAPVPAGGGEAAQWRSAIAAHYDARASEAGSGRQRYYHRRIVHRLSRLVEPGSRVLDIGCGSGDLLSALRPAVGVGVDLSGENIARARRKYPGLRFQQMEGEQVHALRDTFDYVILCQVLGEIYDVRTLLASVQQVCHARTRLIVVHYNRLWQPALRTAEWLGLKARAPEQNWLPADEVNHLLRLARFETVSTAGMNVLPVPVPIVAGLINRVVGQLPLVQRLGLNYLTVARPVSIAPCASLHPSVAIVVPARNEAGHIPELLERIPQLSPRQEVIFVEGGSDDNTWEVIKETATAYRGPMHIKCLRQPGRGKGDAVRAGFAASTAEVLMILDADISVPPEELSAFHDALVEGRGELINGSRMVYLMDRQAMRFLNLLGNKFFGWTFTYLLSQRFRDTLCGTKVLLRSDYERIAAARDYFGGLDPFGDFDILFGAARLGLKITDMPVHYKARTYGTTNISRFRHGWMLLRMCGLAARKLKFI